MISWKNAPWSRTEAGRVREMGEQGQSSKTPRQPTPERRQLKRRRKLVKSPEQPGSTTFNQYREQDECLLAKGKAERPLAKEILELGELHGREAYPREPQAGAHQLDARWRPGRPMAGSADVDLQTGATIASRGLQDAVKDAMARAGVVIEG